GRVLAPPPPPDGGAPVTVGYVLPWGDSNAPAALVDLLSDGVAARMAPRAFASGERRFPAGSVLLPRRAGDRGLEARLQPGAADHGVDFAPVASFYTDAGINLGSEQMVALKPPHVLLVASDGTGFGELRYVLERELAAPFSCVNGSALAGADLR